ncbi:unnamed protein product, partial [Allacma fusca]
MLQFVDALQ